MLAVGRVQKEEEEEEEEEEEHGCKAYEKRGPGTSATSYK